MKAQDKEFQGRSLDEAIAAACAYFDLPREKLEIDILGDAKAGIFGLVGTRKASIMARPAPALETFSVSLQMPKDNERENRGGRDSRESREGRENRENREDRGSGRSEKAGRDTVKSSSQDELDDSEEDGQLAFGLGQAESRREAGENGAGREENALSERPRSGGRERGGRSERRERGDRPERERSERGRERGRPRRDGRQASDDAPRDIMDIEAAGDSNRQEQSPRGQRERRDGGERDGRERRQTPRRDSREDRGGREGRMAGRRERVLSQAASLEKASETEDLDNDQRIAYEGLPETPLADLDQDKLLALPREIMEQMLRPICPEAEITVALGDERVDVAVDCGEASALLIGREGQTLAAMQYLLTRIVGRGMGAAVNMHLDVGAYRQRQDDKLRDLAQLLAERARESGRAQFTRPLSSYHRRIVHMTLQGESDLITRSKGEGALKRVSVASRPGFSGGPKAEAFAAAPDGDEPQRGDE